MILSVPWYMFNGPEHTAILSHFLTFITGSNTRLLCIRFSSDLTLYWFPVCHFRCKEFNPLEKWTWNQNIAISTIVGTSSHIIRVRFTQIILLLDTERWEFVKFMIRFITIFNVFVICLTRANWLEFSIILPNFQITNERDSSAPSIILSWNIFTIWHCIKGYA